MVRHAIEAHSFSARVTPRTREAMVVQNTDRLDALGAVGIARCLMLGGAMGRPLYDPAEPFPDARIPDDTANVLDHFYVKLLHIYSTMTTAAGRARCIAGWNLGRILVATRAGDTGRPRTGRGFLRCANFGWVVSM